MSADLHKKLLAWYDAEKRDLPWRRTRDPYAIWVSEIMLQQTQVATVIPYFEKWMSCFPNAQTLAEADEQEVLSQWQGLGYYRRARMLHQGARFVCENGIPRAAIDLEKVPGIGKYTAGAISSIAFNETAPLVDGNVERVYSRLAADASTGKELNAAAWRWAKDNLSQDRPGDWNQALMELGATICRTVDPRCDLCPLSARCTAFNKALQNEIPTKTAAAKVISREEVLWIPIYKNLFGLRQIQEGQWWHGMWEFLRAPSSDAPQHVSIQHSQRIARLTYHVTNHRIRMEVHLLPCTDKVESLSWFSIDELAELPLPSPQRKALKLALNHLDKAKQAVCSFADEES